MNDVKFNKHSSATATEMDNKVFVNAKNLIEVGVFVLNPPPPAITGLNSVIGGRNGGTMRTRKESKG